MENLAEAFLSLGKEDKSVLGAIETGMRTHEWVPTFVISQLSGLPARKVEYRLKLLFERKLVERESMQYLGFQIGFDTYDLLALSDLVKRDTVLGIGERIGVGKESVVYVNAYTAAPTTGTYAQGDFVKNSAPSGGTPTIGWICTVGGTPGTWVAVSVGGGAGVSDGDKGDITVSSGGTVWDLDLSLDQINVPVASVNFNGQQATSFRIENRTSDPGSPTTGQMWLRTDL